jgi:hypothetical protein
MNESFENKKTPEHKMYENAINSYPDFLADLDSAQDLNDVIDALERHTFVDGGANNEHIFFRVDTSDIDSVEVTPFLTEEFVMLLQEFANDTPTEAEEIDMKIEHVDLNRTVKRILGIV